MPNPVDTLIIKTVELWNQGQMVKLEQGLIYPLPGDVSDYLIRYGYGLPFKSYQTKPSEH